MPALTRLANRQIPVMTGAPDMALPCLRSPQVVVAAAAGEAADCLLVFFWRWTGGRPGTLPCSPCKGERVWISRSYMCSACRRFSARSIGSPPPLNLRAPDMIPMKMPMFVWTWLVMAFRVLAAIPYRPASHHSLSTLPKVAPLSMSAAAANCVGGKGVTNDRGTRRRLFERAAGARSSLLYAGRTRKVPAYGQAAAL